MGIFGWCFRICILISHELSFISGTFKIVYHEVMNRFLKILIYLTFFFFIFGQLGRIHIPDQPVYFYLYELLIALTSIIFIFKYKRQPFRYIEKKLPISLFLIWMGVSFVISLFFYTLNVNIIASLYAIRLTMYGVYIVYLFHHVISTQLKLVVPLIATSGLVLLVSILQFFLYPDIGNIAYLGWDPHISRLVGVFLDPPIAAGMFFLSGWYLVNQAQKAKQHYLLIALLVITFISIALTYSRGAFLAILSVILLFGISLKRYKIAFVMIGTIIILILLIPKAQTESINLMRTTSITARLEDYRKGFEIWQKNPIFGIGYNHIRFEKEKYIDEVFVEDYNPSHGIASFHSSFMIILVTGGVGGLALFSYILFKLSRKSTYFLMSVVFLSTISFFDNVLLHPFILFFLGVMFVADGHSSR